MLRFYGANHFMCIRSHTSLCTSNIGSSVSVIQMKKLEHPNGFNKTFCAFDTENQYLNLVCFQRSYTVLGHTGTLYWLSTVPKLQSPLPSQQNKASSMRADLFTATPTADREPNIIHRQRSLTLQPSARPTRAYLLCSVGISGRRGSSKALGRERIAPEGSPTAQRQVNRSECSRGPDPRLGLLTKMSLSQKSKQSLKPKKQVNEVPFNGQKQQS